MVSIATVIVSGRTSNLPFSLRADTAEAIPRHRVWYITGQTIAPSGNCLLVRGSIPRFREMLDALGRSERIIHTQY